MFIINYCIDSTDNTFEHVANSATDLEYWISMNFASLGNRLVISSVYMI